MIFLVVEALFIIFLIYLIDLVYHKVRKRNNYRINDIPKVKGGYPLIGHAIELIRDSHGFIEKCYQEYGKLFEIKVFSYRMLMICDRDLVIPVLKEKEDKLSFYEIFDRILFFDSFMNKPERRYDYMKMIRQVITMNFNEFMPKIKLEAQRMSNNLVDKIKYNNKVSLINEMRKFIINTSAQCFTKMDDKLTDDFLDNFDKFTNAVNMTITCSTFFPKWLLYYTTIYYGKIYKNRLIKMLDDEIDEYRRDINKMDSILFRKTVDCGEYSNYEIGEMLLILLYASAENTAHALTNTLIELSKDEDIWMKVGEECDKYINKDDDLELVFKSPLIDACVMEAMRLNSHIFAIARRPMSLKTLGDYYIGDYDNIAICTSMLMCGTCANDLYHEPQNYDPRRFLEPRFEKKTSEYILNWSAYVHQCPGKYFSIYEIKTALAYFIINFRRFDSSSINNKKNRFSTSVIASTDSNIELYSNIESYSNK